MNNRFRTGKYKGPIFKLKTKHIQFDEDKDREDVEKMFTRKREIGQPGSSTLGPIVFDKSKRNKRNAPKVENKYLAESLKDNPYYMLHISQDEEDSTMKTHRQPS